MNDDGLDFHDFLLSLFPCYAFLCMCNLILREIVSISLHEGT